MSEFEILDEVSHTLLEARRLLMQIGVIRGLHAMGHKENPTETEAVEIVVKALLEGFRA